MNKLKLAIVISCLVVTQGTLSLGVVQGAAVTGKTSTQLMTTNQVEVISPMRVLVDQEAESEAQAVELAKAKAVDILLTRLQNQSNQYYQPRVHQLAENYPKYVVNFNVSETKEVSGKVMISAKVDIYQELLAQDMKPYLRRRPATSQPILTSLGEEKVGDTPSQMPEKSIKLHDLGLQAGVIMRLQAPGCSDLDRQLMYSEIQSQLTGEGLKVLQSEDGEKQLAINKGMSFEGLCQVMPEIGKTLLPEADLLIFGRVEENGAHIQAYDVRQGQVVYNYIENSNLDLASITNNGIRKILQELALYYGRQK